MCIQEHKRYGSPSIWFSQVFVYVFSVTNWHKTEYNIKKYINRTLRDLFNHTVAAFDRV